MPKNKRYVVRKGHTPGIYATREQCKKQIHGYTQASYKSYPNKNQALQAYTQGKNITITYNTTYSPVQKSISVDAACSGNPGPWEYQIVDTYSKKPLIHQGPFPEGTVNIAEFVGLCHAISYAHTHHIPLIYTDSRTARSRVRQEHIRSSLSPSAHTTRSLAHRAKQYLHTYKNNNTLILHDSTISKQNKKELLDKHTHHKESIHICPRDTRQWGEIPADFNRK